MFADLMSTPVFLDPGKTPVNIMRAPWDDPGASLEDYTQFLQRRFTSDEILHVIPLNLSADGGRFSVKGVLFIPSQQRLIVREHGDVTIYCHRYFVCDDNRTLLPRWARFV